MEMGSPAWLTYPLALTGSRDFTCDGSGMTDEQCTYYMQRWHFWYIADYVFALPTIAFFMSALGIFIIAHFISSQVLGYRRFRGPAIWRKVIATGRYLSYRGFYLKGFRWSSAPVGILLLGAVGIVFFFCMDLLPQPYYWSDETVFGSSPPLGTRSGWMALGCMPFVFATATKTNWITLLTGVSHERLQVFHRWISYAFFVLALMHTFPFIVYHIHWHDMVMQVTMESTIFYWTGIVALVFQAWLTFASHSVIRNLGYEFFKATHLFAVVIFIITFFWHCDATLTSWHYFVATAAVYVPCYVYPWLRTCFEYGFTQKAYIHVEDNGFTRITIPAVSMKWKPGQHCFLRFTSFGIQALSSHPFTICSLPSVNANEKSDLVFYIRHQGGLTKKLYNHALTNPGASVPVLVDGPYGGINMQKFLEADRLLVVAGGSGAGWILPFIELFHRRVFKAADIEQGTSIVAAADKETEESDGSHHERLLGGLPSLRVILATRDSSSQAWFLQTVRELLAKYATASSSTSTSIDLDIQIYLTGDAEKDAHNLTTSTNNTTSTNIPEKANEIAITSISASSSSSTSSSSIINDDEEKPSSSPSPTNNPLSGRPNLPSIIHSEGTQAIDENQLLSVFVCGPTTMQHDVRNAVARENLGIVRGGMKGTRGGGGVYLHSEHFEWA